MKPMTGIAIGCARAAIGKAEAAPTAPMKSRLLMARWSPLQAGARVSLSHRCAEEPAGDDAMLRRNGDESEPDRAVRLPRRGRRRSPAGVVAKRIDIAVSMPIQHVW